jgi:hypothetical protein
MDREWSIMVLESYGAGPWMIWLICGYWHDAIMVCRAAGKYGTAFEAGCGITQGSPLSAKLFNILVDAVVWEWMQQLEEDGDIATFFAIFYVNNAFLASRDAGFLQHTLTLLVDLFKRVGLQANTTKTQTLVCTPGHIRTQLPSESYRRMQTGWVTASEWNSCNIECHQCGKELKASSLGRHLADVHDVYQQAVIAKELLETQPPVLCMVSAELHA